MWQISTKEKLFRYKFHLLQIGYRLRFLKHLVELYFTFLTKKFTPQSLTTFSIQSFRFRKVTKNVPFRNHCRPWVGWYKEHDKGPPESPECFFRFWFKILFYKLTQTRIIIIPSSTKHPNFSIRIVQHIWIFDWLHPTGKFLTISELSNWDWYFLQYFTQSTIT